jgi:hypothetical protein
LKRTSTLFPTTLPLVMLPTVNFFAQKKTQPLLLAQKGPFNHRNTKFWLHIVWLIFNCDLGKWSWQEVTKHLFPITHQGEDTAFVLKFIHNPWPYFLDSLQWALMWSFHANYSLALAQCMPQEDCHYDLTHLEPRSPSQTWLNKMGFDSYYGLCNNWNLEKILTFPLWLPHNVVWSDF